MSFDSNDLAINLKQLSKCYHIYEQPKERLKQVFYPRIQSLIGIEPQQYYREFWALHDVTVKIKKGEVIGIIGRNGSGKSTLLQMVCGTLSPTSGDVIVNGRIAALLELGAGFNPEFTGRENVYMSAAILGLTEQEINTRLEDVIDFSGIRDFIDQPVKTYSSGMYVRLAFSVAINVDPDILVIDEALSVGDGEFSRKSFERIMSLKDEGKTILFCSHSMYQVEAICDRVIWLDKGRVASIGEPNIVANRYGRTLTLSEGDKSNDNEEITSNVAKGCARIINVEASADGLTSNSLSVISLQSDLRIVIEFAADPELPTPSVAVTFSSEDAIGLSSTSSFHDGLVFKKTSVGNIKAVVDFPEIPLLKGEYMLSVYLACENAIHSYDNAVAIIRLTVTQESTEQGYVMLPHHWGQLSE